MKKDSSGGKKSGGVSRRTFIKSVGLSSVGVAAIDVGNLSASGLFKDKKILGPDKFQVSLNVNGREVPAYIEPRTTLVEVLRDQFHLTGTKIGCDRGACGACTVILGNKTVSSCMTLAVDAIGIPVQTIEGLASSSGELHAVQKSFIEHDAMQCGFCTPGMIMSCKDLLDHDPSPGDKEIKTAVSGNLCRCGTYPNVFKAVKTAAKK